MKQEIKNDFIVFRPNFKTIFLLGSFLGLLFLLSYVLFQQNTIRHLEMQISTLNNTIEDIENRISDLEYQNSEIDDKIQTIENSMDQ